MNRLITVARYVAGFLIMFYGFAKLTGAQFTVLESELDKPMREVDGFWLTWYYFGYSAAYGNLIAVLQVFCGIGLLFRKTTLLSAILLLGIMANILMVDFFFGIRMSGTIMAIIITVLLLLIVSPHIRRLLAVLLMDQPAETKRQGVGIWLLRALVIIIPACFTYYVANFNNRNPTALDGRWAVTERVPSNTVFDSLQTVYFERNRAFMVVFRYPNSWQKHEFHVNGNKLSIKEGYLLNGKEKLNARFDLAGESLQIVDDGRKVALGLIRW